MKKGEEEDEESLDLPETLRKALKQTKEICEKVHQCEIDHSVVEETWEEA